MAKNIPFIFLLLTIIVATLSKGSLAGTVFELIHKDHINLPETRYELLTQMLQRGNSNRPGAAPLVAGRYNGSVTGHYFAKIKMGTPAQELLMDIDTGSDVTWMNCLHNGKQVKQNPTGFIFKADKSRSFREIQCGSPTCRTFIDIDKCRSGRQRTCGFNFRYRDVQMHVVLASETVTLDLKNGKTAQLRDVLVGCSDYSSDMDGATNGASGVLGLSYSKLSLRSKTSESFGNKLSYCLLDPLTPIDKSSYLIFGSYEGVNIRFDQIMQYTYLIQAGSYYGLNIKDACVNGKCNILLNLPTKPLVFNSKGHGGVVIDTGTLATLLVEEAYMPIIGALDAFYKDFKITKQGPFEVCYTKGRNKRFPKAPKLKFVFNDGKEFEPHPESYVIDIDENMSCLGFINIGKVSLGINSVFGIGLQQRFFWELDLKNNKLGFASSNCIVGS
ncbi:hypothetical protein CASFOL_040555 [Castilleja foliolosa]|uniref:Peptidase A1 domain-containing protein n=1 Tax=Castilleja foliolosa TaxID=1961234 RepID=A0ABD3BCA8_9LAMI